MNAVVKDVGARHAVPDSPAAGGRRHAVPELPPTASGPVSVIACPHPFRMERHHLELPHGLTVGDMLRAAQPDAVLRRHAFIFVGDQLIPRDYWDNVRPKPGTTVNIRVVPTGGGGGKNPLRIVLSIAVIAGSIAIGNAFGAELAIGLFGAAGPVTAGQVALSSALITGAVGIGGSLLVNAIAPPSVPKLSSLSAQGETASPTLFIEGARNSARPFGVVPSPLGKHRMVPPYGALPFTEIVGDDQFLRLLFVWGYGPLNITNLKIGETDIASFTDVEIETRQGFASDAPLTLFPNDVFEDALDILINNVSGWIQQTSQANADELSVGLTFKQGLFEFSGGGQRLNRRVRVQIEYRVASPPGSWILAGIIDITSRKSSAIREGLRWKVARDQYDVRVQRLTLDSSDDEVFDKVHWSVLRTITNEDPISQSGIAKTALRIKATDQLNGIVDTLNGVVESLVKDWNGAAWVGDTASSNPASLLRHVLQGPANARPLADSRLDLTALQNWHDKNVTEMRQFNMVVDFQSSVLEMLSDIAAAGRAAPAAVDGKWSVVIDEPKTSIIQHFTPRNSWGFTGKKVFRDLPHAWRIRFINRDQNWRQDERIVYFDGFDQATATKFEALELAGVTHSDQIFKDGKYHEATAKLRPETYSFFTDIEKIQVTRGDLIRVSHDVTLWGIGAARVKSVQLDGSNNATGVTLDEPFAMESGKNYNIRFRKSDGSSILHNVDTVPGETDTFTFTTPIPAANPQPQADDLAMFGEQGTESVELIVKSIEHAQDLTAKLICVDAAPGVHTADQGTIPTFDSQITPPVVIQTPQVTDTRSDETVLLIGPDGIPETRILVTLGLINKLPLDKLESLEARYRESATAGPWQWIPPLSPDAREVSITGVEEGEFYDINLRYRFKDGTLGDWTVVSMHQVVGILKNPRSEKLLGWPGTLVDCHVTASTNLAANGAQTIADLPATISALADTINEIVTSKSPIQYTTLTIDLGADVTFSPRVTTDADGAVTVTMQTGTDADGAPVGAFVSLAVVTARYIKIRLDVSGALPFVRELLILLDSLTQTERYEDVDTSSLTNPAWFESIAMGHFKIETQGEIEQIRIARVDAFQNVGPGYTAEVISKSTTLTGGSLPAAEFKIYDSTGVLADATVDITLIGARA